MKFGFRVYPYHVFPDLAAVADWARYGESLGYDYICLPEHVLFPQEHEEEMGAVWWEPLLTAAYLASATTRLGITFCVLVAPLHHPIRLAKQLATLDAIAGGRVVTGLAPGWLEEEVEWMGGDWRHRGTQTEECIEVIRALFSAQPATFQGAHWSFSDASFMPKPPRGGRTPLYVGGSALRSAARAARVGDGWMPMSSTFEDFETGVGRLREELARLDRDREEFPIVKYLPGFEMSPEVRSHTRATGAHVEEPFGGDWDATIAHVRRCEALGVTGLTVLLSTDLTSMRRELAEFRENVIERLR